VGSRPSPATHLSPETLLQIAPGARTRFDAARHVLLDAPDGTVVDLGPRGYTTLSLFAYPLALGDAIERLEREARSTDFAPTMNVLNMLIEEGALVRADADGRPTTGWADPVEHARMLHDDRRTGDYLAALLAAVRPGDVVLDIGTGSGVLAVAAARAGARRVYAVEASDIAEVAGRVFAANGVTDTVTLVPGWSRQIELPEPADLLVAEIIGNEPFEEEILETTLDARHRLLKGDARLIPHTLTILVRPLCLPDGEARQRAIGRAAVGRWRRLYDMEFQPLLDAAALVPVNMPTEAEVVATWPPVGPAVTLVDLDLGTFESASVRASADLVLDEPETVNAVAVTFRAALYDAIEHTLDPWTWPTSSWATSVWVLQDPVRVETGAALRVLYNRRVAGAPDGLTCEIVEKAR
jgi:Ribosomal protein L11 methyltransferase (PrmA)